MSTLDFKRSLPLDDSWDVIVAGGGPAGCTAAAAAAREGARTLLLEATGALGGMGTSGLVPAWCPFSDKEKIIYRGLAEKVFNATKAGMPHIDKNALDWVTIDPELLKRVYDDLVTGAGAAVLFNTQLCAVETDGRGAVGAIITANKAGLAALKAKVYVDCTGDGDLSARGGAEFHKGDDATGELQPATHCFILTNIDEEVAGKTTLYRGDKKSRINEIMASGRYPEIIDGFFIGKYIGSGTYGFNAGHIWDVDNTDPASVSKALIQGRKIADAFLRGLKEFAPEAFGKALLAATGSLIGARETRRIVGDYVLTIDDFIARRSFPDEICRNSYEIDVHTSKAEIEKARSGDIINMLNRSVHYEKGESHGIPYRCLTPKGLKNALVAGRSISCDRLVQGSVRVMPVCLAMGEAAGMAAAHAAKNHGCDVHAVDTGRLRARLKEEGAYLP